MKQAFRRLTIPRVGRITAMAIVALAPPTETFRAGRDLAAGLGLTPLQELIGGTRCIGATCKVSERTIRRLLIIGSSAVARHVRMRGALEGTWLARMLAGKPRMLLTVALANNTGQIGWALLTKGGSYRAPVAPACAASRP